MVNKTWCMKTKFYSLIVVLFLVLQSSVTKAQTACLVPSGMTNGTVSTTSATVNWLANTTGSYYKVQYHPVGMNPIVWTQFYAQTNSYTFTGLTCGTSYEWQVQSICANVGGVASSSAFSAGTTFTTLSCNTTCTAPANLSTSTINNTNAVATWTTVNGAMAYLIQYRQVNSGTATWLQATVTSPYYTFPNLLCGTAYEWQVQSICSTTAGGSSAFSATTTFTTLSCTTTCPNPTAIPATNITSSSATLSWSSPAPTPAYFIVQYHPVNTATWTSLTVTSNQSISLTALACNTTYEWKVQTVCSTSGTSGSSGFSAVSSFTTAACPVNCTAPGGLTASAVSANSATLSWTAPAGAIYYKVQYRPTLPANSAWVTQTVTAGTSFVLQNLACATTYEWQVQTVCASTNGVANTSAFSASSTFTTLACTVICPVPAGLSSSSISTNSAVLTWNAASGAMLYVLQYRLLTSAITPWTQVTVQGTSYTLANLQCGVGYEWQVQTVCASGTPAGSSAFSASANFSTLACTTICPVPTLIPASNISANGATLSWITTAPAPAYYILQYHLVNTATWISVTIANNQSYSLTSLSCNSNYEWKVQSICSNSGTSGGTSVFSPPQNFSTLACSTNCASPSNPITSAISNNSAMFSWTATAGATVYNLQYKQSNVGAGWTQTTVQGTSFTVNNLLCNTQYEWQVAAVCSPLGGSTALSAYTAGVVFTTAACSATCPTPTGMTSANITSNSAYLGWTAQPGVMAYILQYRPILPNVPPTNPWIQQTLQSNTLLLANLQCNTLYEWQVKSICSTTSGGTSVFTSSVTFTTAACPVNCVAPQGLFATNITPSSALLKWTSASSTGTFSIRYRKLNTSA